MSDLQVRNKQRLRPPDIAPATPIKRPDLVALVTESVRQRILDGTYPPGSELPAQGTLAANFDVSLNVVREAMRNLRSLGMVEVSQGRCPTVRGSNPEASINAFFVMLSHAHGSLYHLIESRIPLEIQVATLAAERATPENIARLAEVIDDSRKTHDPQGLSLLDQSFHRYLAETTGNPLLMVMIDTLAGLQCQLTQQAHASSQVTEASIAEHVQILKAVEAHDEKAAGQAMLRHLEAVLLRIPKDRNPTAPLTESEFEKLKR